MFFCKEVVKWSSGQEAKLGTANEGLTVKVGLWVSESHRKSGTSSYEPWPPHEIFWKIGQSRRHVS